jgi:hypothetical protein
MTLKIVPQPPIMLKMDPKAGCHMHAYTGGIRPITEMEIRNINFYCGFRKNFKISVVKGNKKLFDSLGRFKMLNHKRMYGSFNYVYRPPKQYSSRDPVPLNGRPRQKRVKTFGMG